MLVGRRRWRCKNTGQDEFLLRFGRNACAYGHRKTSARLTHPLPPTTSLNADAAAAVALVPRSRSMQCVAGPARGGGNDNDRHRRVAVVLMVCSREKKLIVRSTHTHTHTTTRYSRIGTKRNTVAVNARVVVLKKIPNRKLYLLNPNKNNIVVVVGDEVLHQILLLLLTSYVPTTDGTKWTNTFRANGIRR